MATTDLQRILGKNVRTLRMQQGLSQERFGDAVGLHRTYVGGVERGERNLTLQTVSRLGEVLGVGPLALLIDWDTPELPPNPLETTLRAAARGDDPGTGARRVARDAGKARPARRPRG